MSKEAIELLLDEYGWKLTEYNDEGGYVDDDADFVDSSTSKFGSALTNGYSICGSRNNEKIRTHPDVIEVVEQLGDDAAGRHASLKIVEIPDGVDWTIKEYDGAEWIAEEHRTWR